MPDPHAAPSLPDALAENALLVPRRTAAGQAALERRTRELTPRQRTMLFMVDGRRTVDIVLALGSQAGAQAADFSRLLSLGLVETTSTPTAPTAPTVLPPPGAGGMAPAPDAASSPALASVAPSSASTGSAPLPTAQTLAGDSNWSQPASDSMAPIEDGPLNEARALLIRAVRRESPVAGTFTLLRLKRATTRAQLEALLDEVEQRLRKPHRRVIATQMLRHVRHLLTLPPNSRTPVIDK
jgi:hypothetical protein